MKMQIYGSGCDKCRKLAANAETAARKLGIEIELEKVSDINAITDAGVMMTPALAINGKVVSSGKPVLQTVRDEDLQAIADEFGVKLNQAFLG